jgi:Flp pilus assembly protein CpaB
MTPRRTIVVVAAIVVALVAGGLAYVFLHNAQQNAFKNAKLVPAYVVSKNIPRGLAGADAVNGGYFSKKDIPQEIRPTTAITNLSAIAGDTAVANFTVGQVLVNGMFVTPSQAAVTFAQLIPPGDVAVSVSVDAVHAVGDLPQPGDKVDILITNNGSTQFLLQNVPILAVGSSIAGQTSTASTTQNNSGLFTFAATPLNAARIATAQQQSLGIYLLLVPPNNPVVAIPGVNPSNILSGPPS